MTLKKRYIYIKTVGSTVHIRQYISGTKADIPGGVFDQLALKFKPGNINNKLLDFDISGTEKKRSFDITSEVLDANLTLSITSLFSGTDGEALCYTAAPLPDAEALAVDKAELSVPSTISDNITLPSLGANGTAITWSEPTGVISPSGIVTRPAYGTSSVPVSITAYLSKGDDPLTALTDTKVFSVTVMPQTMDITTTPPASGPMVRYPYTLTFTVLGGTPPYTFSLASGSLPDGLSLSPDGVLSGTPTYNNTFNFVLRVTDSTNDNASKAFSLTVAKQIVDAAVSTLDTSAIPSSVRKGNAFSFKVAIKDNTASHLPISGLGYPGDFVFSRSGDSAGTLNISNVTEDSNYGIYTVTASYTSAADINIAVTVDGVAIPGTASVHVVNN